MTLDGDAWPTLGEGGVPALWDQIPEGAKWQIITAIGCLEWYDEWQYDNPAAQMPAMADKPKHYMRGGQPGAYLCWKSTDAVTAKSRRWRELPRHRADAITRERHLVDLHAIEPTRSRRQRRVDGVKLHAIEQTQSRE